MDETYFDKLWKHLGRQAPYGKPRDKATEADRWLCVQLDKLEARISRLEQSAKRGGDE